MQQGVMPVAITIFENTRSAENYPRSRKHRSTHLFAPENPGTACFDRDFIIVWCDGSLISINVGFHQAYLYTEILHLELMEVKQLTP